ncbi:hypothetical protein CPB85DRAFT_1276923 [Mucidula mucida]|nr:hypothetical protein CPB85DRAFT_1276923 [Mucidula mucida]
MVSFKSSIFSIVFAILFVAQEAFAFHYTERLAAKHDKREIAKRELTLNTASSRHTTATLSQDDIPAACSDSCSTEARNAITNCTLEACICGDNTDQAVGTCMQCVVDQGIVTADLGTAVHKQYETTCSHRGVRLATTSGATAVRAGIVATVPLVLISVATMLL